MKLAIISGNVGQAPKILSQNCMVFSVAVRGWSKEDGETTTWLNCRLIGKRVENLSKLIQKGSKVLVNGEIELREFEHNGQKRREMDVVCFDVELVGGKPTGEATNTIKAEESDDVPF